MSAFTWRSASSTSKGNVRSHNEDAVLELPAVGLWVVADGMGGHNAGDVASRMIVESLCAIARPRRFSELLDNVEDCLRSVNERLCRVSKQSGGAMTGSTVAALLAFDCYCLSLWAGDSRVYRLRESALTCITRDHSEVQALLDEGVIDVEAAAQHVASNVITRAVGGAQELCLDLELRELRDGDRYLLCSDGLYKELNDAALTQQLAQDDVVGACKGLMSQALSGSCNDNVSVVAVEFIAPAGRAPLTMTEDIGRQLRALARDYANSRLTLDAYRRLRAPLLDSLVIAQAASVTSPSPRDLEGPSDSRQSAAPARPDAPPPPVESARSAEPGATAAPLGGVQPARAVDYGHAIDSGHSESGHAMQPGRAAEPIRGVQPTSAIESGRAIDAAQPMRAAEPSRGVRSASATESGRAADPGRGTDWGGASDSGHAAGQGYLSQLGDAARGGRSAPPGYLAHDSGADPAQLRKSAGGFARGGEPRQPGATGPSVGSEGQLGPQRPATLRELLEPLQTGADLSRLAGGRPSNDRSGPVGGASDGLSVPVGRSSDSVSTPVGSASGSGVGKPITSVDLGQLVDPSRSIADPRWGDASASSMDPLAQLGKPGPTAEVRRLGNSRLDGAAGSRKTGDLDAHQASRERLARVGGLTRAELRWVVVIVVGVVLTAALATWFLRDPTDAAGRTGREVALTEGQPKASSARILKLVEPLLASSDWSEAQIDAVNAGLLEEGSRQIAAEQHTDWFRRFADEVRRRLKAEHTQGVHHLAPSNSSLAALALTIGLDPQAPDEPLRPPRRGDSR